MNGQPLLRASALAPSATEGVGVEAHRHGDAAALLSWCRRLATPTAILVLGALLPLAAVLVCTFLFARSCGLSRGAALISAIAFALSLPVVVWLEHPLAGAIAWLPWILLCTVRVIAARGSPRWLVGAAA